MVEHITVVRARSYSTLFNMDAIVGPPLFDIRCFKRVYTRNFIAAVHACGSQIIRSLHTEWSFVFFAGLANAHSQRVGVKGGGGRRLFM